MYESPITAFYNDIAATITEKTEHTIMAQVQMFVDVDKEELIKALNYDRKQYEAGYNDGFIDGRKKAIEEITSLLKDKF